MNETAMANIIRELSEQLHTALKELQETKETLVMVRNDSADWFTQYQIAKKELNAIKHKEEE